MAETKARFKLTAPDVVDGESAQLRCNNKGELMAVEAPPAYEDNGNGAACTTNQPIAGPAHAWSSSSSAGTSVGTAGVSVKASPGRVRLIRVYNKNTVPTSFVAMVVDKATAPVNADAPIDRQLVAGNGGTVLFDYGPEGCYFANGIALAASTVASPDTVTLIAANDMHFFIEWI
jgi:hypothetical protein